MQSINYKSRGAGLNPANRFEKLHYDFSDSDIIQNESSEEKKIPTEYYVDNSKSILAKNDSYDIPFTYSLNPYRGCEHGCIYCYARQTHEYLGFSSGLDFETKILVKKNAPELLEKTFQSKSWKPEFIVLSGNTDCYQPLERKLEITRKCLEVFLKFRNPVSIITKNSLVERDIDIISELAKLNLVSVTISITSLQPELIRRMEPRTSAPHSRLKTIRTLAENKIPVSVNIAPLIPGLNDEEIPEILKQTAALGATSAHYILLRLPYSVKNLFVEWLHREYPEKADKILNKIMEMRGGKLNESDFFERFQGKGKTVDMIENLFKVSCAKYNFNKINTTLRTDLFTKNFEDQLKLF